MDVSGATDIIADVTRRALEALDTFPDGAELRAAIVIIDVCVPDADDPDNRAEDYTHTVWKAAPHTVSTNWAYGMAMTAGQGMLMQGGPDDGED